MLTQELSELILKEEASSGPQHKGHRKCGQLILHTREQKVAREEMNLQEVDLTPTQANIIRVSGRLARGALPWQANAWVRPTSTDGR